MITLFYKIFTFSCFWAENVILQMFVPKINGKDLFFSLNFDFCDQVNEIIKMWLETTFRGWYMKMIYIAVANLKKILLNIFIQFYITVV